MKQYRDLLKKILEYGQDSDDRTGVGTISLFGPQMEFDLQEGFPAVTTKKLAWKAVVSELLWFIEGSDDERRLREILHESLDKETIWTENAEAEYWKPKARFNGDVGRIYGVQWRSWKTYEEVPNYGNRGGFTSEIRENQIDQLSNLIGQIKTNPDSRRLVLTAWNPGELDQMALPPCHVMSQFRVQKGYLHCKMYQRSADAFLGVPFNIASYALLTHMIAAVCNLKPGRLIITIGDAHIYNNHISQVHELLAREPYPLPLLSLNNRESIDEFSMEDIFLIGYKSHPALKAPMAV
jgi:thymidylate synthase